MTGLRGPNARRDQPRPVVAVVDYGIGNLRSAEKALDRVGADARLTADVDVIAAADAVVIAGVGNFGRCMEALRAGGLDRPTLAAVEAGTPVMGICVGMQMLYEASQEAPGVPGLGVLTGTVALLPDTVKRPQIQWNLVERRGRSGLFDGLDDPIWAYFVHSYAAPDSDAVVATCDYGGPVPAAVEQGNVWATQFHPEKSSDKGLAVLANFARAAARAAQGVQAPA